MNGVGFGWVLFVVALVVALVVMCWSLLRMRRDLEWTPPDLLDEASADFSRAVSFSVGLTVAGLLLFVLVGWGLPWLLAVPVN